MLIQKQRKDNLTKTELKVYSYLCYGATICMFLCIYLSAKAHTNQLAMIISIIGFVFLTVGAILGFAIKHDTRVLDLRGKSKK
jgi:hypothetical protein